MDFIKTAKINNVRLVDRFNGKKATVGTLYMTTTHLIFVDSERKLETWVLLTHISAIEKLPLSTIGSPLQIRCKTFQSLTFVIQREKDCQDAYTSLVKLSSPVNVDDLYAFHYMPSSNSMHKSAGWNIYDARTEFARMGVPNEHWCMSNINSDYELCDTYPKQICVPRSASTPIVVGSSKFRSRGRLPVLSYLLESNNASITRCSQPLSGFSARCLEDEQMLHCVLKANPDSKFMYIVDTRPKINAMANKATGKGYESEMYYSDIKFTFLGIENIHVMRSSLQKLIEVCEMKDPTMSLFYENLQSSGWLKHIKSVLDTSLFISNAIATEGVSILVHCSDGWDRTAQTIALASLLLDPFYRTILGFMILIEKEWISFGHKFTDRCGHVQVDPRETSPVFTQFIDATWQVMQQFPTAFQFNERFLLTLHDHVFSCQFGTFIGNCEKDKQDLRLSETTYSLWGFMLQNQSEYANPLYNKEKYDTVLQPSSSPQNIQFWRGMYNRFESGIHPRESTVDLLCVLNDQNVSMEDHIRLLDKRITSLKSALGHEDTSYRNSQEKGDCIPAAAQSSLDSGCDNWTTSSTFSPPPALPDVEAKYSVNSEVKSGDNESGVESLELSQCIITDAETSNEPSIANNEQFVDIIAFSQEQLNEECESVAVEWKSLRNITSCPCLTTFENFSRKYHCWRCGDVFCTRCIDKYTSLPGHYSQQPVPVCRTCHKNLHLS